MLRPFRYLDPITIADASIALARLGDEAKVYAGGAELLLLVREGIVRPTTLVDVKHIGALSGIAWQGDVLRIGATETHARVAAHPLVRTHAPMLAEAATHIGNVRVRAQGTIGGNLCFADPHADPATVLLAYDTTVVAGSAAGTREIALDAFLKDTYEVDLAPDELLVEIRTRPAPAGWRYAYLRFEQYYRPTLNVAVSALVTSGVVAEARLVVGCVGRTALRLRDLETRLRGTSITDAIRLVGESKPYLTETLDPVDDLLGSAEFKIHLTAVHLADALRRVASAEGGARG